MLLAIVAADLVLDWLFRMDLAQRTVVLTIMVSVLLAGIYRWLVRPLTTDISDDALVLQVERINPQLGQALITSVQLSRNEGRHSHGVSVTLMRRAIELGPGHAGLRARQMDLGVNVDSFHRA